MRSLEPPAPPRLDVSVPDGFEVIAIQFKEKFRASDRDLLEGLTPFVPHYEFSTVPAVLVRVPIGALERVSTNARVARASRGLVGGALGERPSFAFQSRPRGSGFGAVHATNSVYGSAAFGSGVQIALFDMGIDCGLYDMHPQFGYTAGCAGQRFSVYGGVPIADPEDSHGTRVASIMMAGWGNGLGVRGASPMITLHNVRVARYDEGTSSIPVSQRGFNCNNTAAGMDWAWTHLTSASIWVLAFYTARADNQDYWNDCWLEHSIIANAVSADRLVLAAGGNISKSGAEVPYPGRLPGVAAIGAVACSSLSGDECTGTLNYWNDAARGAQIAIAAPGVNIPVLDQYFDYTDNVVSVSGTSYAVPHVASAAALLMSRYNTTMTGPCILTHLKATALVPVGWRTTSQGSGVLDIENAWNTPLDILNCRAGPT